jgi:DNA-binding transcriptional LysR family regulator
VPWVLNIQGTPTDVETPGRIRCAQDILAPVTVSKSGFGLAQTYRYLVQNELRTGELEEVMTGFAGARRPFSLLYPANRHLPLRVRVLIDFLIQRFQLNGNS